MQEDVDEVMAALEELENRAQPGPWEWACDFEVGHASHWNVHRVNDPTRTVCLGLVSIANREWSIGKYPTPEMQLVVAARNAVPALIAEIRRLREKVAEKAEGVSA
jgi:hypothetical protein